MLSNVCGESQIQNFETELKLLFIILKMRSNQGILQAIVRRRNPSNHISPSIHPVALF